MQERLGLAFHGYIGIFSREHNQDIPTDIAWTIFQFFNEYDFQKFDVNERLFNLFNPDNGYNEDVRRWSLEVLAQISSYCDYSICELYSNKYDILNQAKIVLRHGDIGDNKYWLVHNFALDVPALYNVELMGIMIEVFMKEFKQNDLDAILGNYESVLSTIIAIASDLTLKQVISEHRTMVHVMEYLAAILERNQSWVTSMKTIDDVLNKILDFIVHVLSNDLCEQFCVKQIRDANGVELLRKLKDSTVEFTVDESISTRCESIMDVYFNF